MKHTLGKKLGLGFGVILALRVLSARLAYVKGSAMKEMQDRTIAVRMPTIKALTDLQRSPQPWRSRTRPPTRCRAT